MSIKSSKSICGKYTAIAMLAASIVLTSGSAVLAQSSADTNAGSAATDGATSSASSSSSNATSAATSAPLPGDNSGASSDAGSSDTTTTTTTSTTPTSDIPPGVLWTDPKYAVKEVPQPKQVAPTKGQPTTGTTAAATTPATSQPAATSNVYDEKAAQAFADSVGLPQYVWTKQENATAAGKAKAALISKEMAAYNKSIVEKFVANMTVPNSATLVENSSNQYVYLISFTIDGSGKISKINSERSFGQFNALHLADDNENAAMTNSITTALAKCSPLKVPPVGTSPWYMLLKFEPNTGKVFVANLNSN